MVNKPPKNRNDSADKDEGDVKGNIHSINSAVKT